MFKRIINSDIYKPIVPASTHLAHLTDAVALSLAGYLVLTVKEGAGS